MAASGASLDLNWLLGLLGLGEKGASISDRSIKTWLQILFFTLVIGFWFLLYHLAEDTESNHSVNEVDDLDEFDNVYELDQYFHEEDSHRTTVSGGGDGRRHGGCAFCGNFATTRCSRCKSARYW